MSDKPFNPDEYADWAQANPVASPAFDPAQYARDTAPRVGELETYANAGAGALPLGNPLVNIILALRRRDQGTRARLTPQAREEAARMGLDTAEAEDPSLLQDYRDVRDARRERQALGKEQNPTLSRLGTLTGVAASVSAPLRSVAARGGQIAGRLVPAASGLGRVAGAAFTGGAYGGLQGLTDGDADLTRGEVLGALQDTASGLEDGLVLGSVGGMVGEGARMLAPYLRRLAVRNTKEAIQGSSDIGAATRKPMRDESAELMLDEGQVRRGDNAQNIADRVVPQADREGARLGQIIRALEDSGYTGPNARALGQALERRGVELSPNLSSDKSPARVFADEGASIRTNPRPLEDATFRGTGPVQSESLGLQQAENIKSSIQGRAKFQKMESTEREESLKQAARTVRQATEDSLFEQAASRDYEARRAFRELGYSPEEMAALGAGNTGRQRVQQFLEQKSRTGRYLDAAQFSKRGASKFDQRPRVGLLDTIGAQKADTVLGSQLLARALSEVRNRSASTLAVEQNALSRSLNEGRASGALGAGFVQGAPEGLEEAESRLDPRVRALIQVLTWQREAQGR